MLVLYLYILLRKLYKSTRLIALKRRERKKTKRRKRKRRRQWERFPRGRGIHPHLSILDRMSGQFKNVP